MGMVDGWRRVGLSYVRNELQALASDREDVIGFGCVLRSLVTGNLNSEPYHM